MSAVATDLGALLAFTVRGTPAPQGSKRAVIHKSTGRPVVIESSDKVKPWRAAVSLGAVMAMGDAPLLIDTPVLVDMVFTFARPRNHYRAGRNAHLLRDEAPTRPASYPDLSKLLRSTEDACTDAGVWVDDSRVVEYGRLAKVFAGEDGDALDSPGAVIRVWPLVQVVQALPNQIPGLFDPAMTP